MHKGIGVRVSKNGGSQTSLGKRGSGITEMERFYGYFEDGGLIDSFIHWLYEGNEEDGEFHDKQIDWYFTE